MFTVNVNVITVRLVMLIARMFWWFPTGRDVKTAFLHASLDGQEEVYVRPPPLLWRWGFTEKGAWWRLKKGGQSYLRKLLEFHVNAVPAQPLARQIGMTSLKKKKDKRKWKTTTSLTPPFRDESGQGRSTRHAPREHTLTIKMPSLRQ